MTVGIKIQKKIPEKIRGGGVEKLEKRGGVGHTYRSESNLV